MTRTKKRILTAIAAIAALAMIGVIVWLSIWVSRETDRAEAARLEVENSYATALYDGLNAVTEAENGLAKWMVSVSEAESVAIAADVYKDATSAAEVVGRLPVEIYRHEGLLKFLNQVGDFAGSYIRAAGVGGDLSVYDALLEDVYIATVNVRAVLSDAVGNLGKEGYSLLDGIEENGNLRFGDGDVELEYPSMIYDGPFSDSTEKCEWKGLEGCEPVRAEDALRTLEERLGFEGTVIGTSGGDEELYQAQGKIGGREAFASVTKRGGKIVGLTVASEDGEGTPNEEKVKTAALRYAEKLGYTDGLQAVWYNELGSAAMVNLAPVSNGVVFYPDLIKIKIGSDGSLLGVEACAYCTNHRTRVLPRVSLDEKTAVSRVSKRLTVSNVRPVVIPKGRTERYCYEVAAEYKGLDYFVYVDAVTGEQVDILRVIDGHQGKLVA